MTPADVEAWLDALSSAWEVADPVRIGELFTDDARYQPSPFAPGLEGRDEIVAYWASEMGAANTVRVSWGRPVVAGRRVAVEWWATVNEGTAGAEVDTGALILVFAGRRCSSLREYWMLGEQRSPPPGWGS